MTGKLEELKAYKIEFMGLANGKHRFSFDIGSEFFACFERSEIQNADVHLDLQLEKEDNMLVLDFDFRGWLEVTCDRCLDVYREPVDFQRRIYVKFGDEYVEQTEDIIVIPHTETQFDVSQLVYEFLHLALPLRRVHSGDAAGQTGCDPDMLARVEAHKKEKKQKGDGEPVADSPFEALKSLLFKKDN